MATTTPLRRAGWVAMTVLAAALALYSARYFSLNPAVFIPPQVPVYLAHLGPLLLHVAGGTVALAVGPWQFLGRLRARRPRAHRLLGRVYLAAVLSAGVGGLLLAPLSLGGPMAHVGFATLAVVLLGVSAMALVRIRQGRVAEHRAWMTRSYALIFAAVTLRVWLLVFGVAGVPFDQMYVAAAWSSWLINLVGAELVLGRQARSRRAAAPAATIRAAG
jgi:uncharacterized membrane protein